MRHLDVNPYYRSTVGFDRVFNILDSLVSAESASPTYPPYNIERLDDNSYRISMAVAGFPQSDLTIEVTENVLVIKGGKQSADEETTEYLHRGIGTRAFERKFQLADYVEVESAGVENGLLHIDLFRNIPERMKARTVEITGPGPKQIAGKKKAN